MSPLLQKILLLFTASLSGCSTLSYYMDAINGHAEILNRQHTVDEVISNPDTSETLRSALLDFQQARTFAVNELLLPDNNSYRNYADIGRDYAVWNVIAAPRLSVEPRQWCFLVIGCFNYRGFFREYKAQEYARRLNEDGFDTYVAGSRAYSTLGWFEDPLLNTMILQDQANRIGLLFHELAHQKIYFDNDSAFNEAFAVFVEQEGVRRWLIARHKDDLYARYTRTLHRRAQFHALLLDTRAKLSRIYNSNRSDTFKLQKKSELFAELKQDYQKLKQTWEGYAGYDVWMQQSLNNAHLALVATYREQVALFDRLLACHNGDLQTFYRHIRELEPLDRDERRQALERLAVQCH